MLRIISTRGLRNALFFLGGSILIIGLLGLATLAGNPATKIDAPGGIVFSQEGTPDGDLLEVGQLPSSTRQPPDETLDLPLTNNNPTPEELGTRTATPYPLIYSSLGASMPVTWGDYPGPEVWPSTAVPPPIGILPKPDDQINILLLGNDNRPGMGTRTDSIMLLTLNPSTGTASVTSFPRAMYVFAPGRTMYMLNTVQPRGGFDLMAMTFEYNFGVRPDYFVNITMSNFIEIIDTIGGLDVEVHVPLYDKTYADGKYSVEPGIVHMDGRMARWYARSRYTTSDFDRVNRQQEVIKAIFLQLMNTDVISRVPELYEYFAGSVATNLPLVKLLEFIPLSIRLLDTSKISRHGITQDQMIFWLTPRDGAQVYLPIREFVIQVMTAALAP